MSRLEIACIDLPCRLPDPRPVFRVFRVFPDCTEKQKDRIRKLAEELDAHRKRAQQQHGLGLTDIYNVLEKLRASDRAGDGPAPVQDRNCEMEPARPRAGDFPILSAKDKAVHDAALVATLRQLHDELDAAVADAYGWPWPLTDAEILQRVVDLNAARAAEEKAGIIRWLRPEYQAKGELLLGETAPRSAGNLPASPTPSTGRLPVLRAAKPAKQPWPATIPARIQAVEHALALAEHPLSIPALVKQFSRAKERDVAEIVETLCSLGRARPGDQSGTYVR